MRNARLEPMILRGAVFRGAISKVSFVAVVTSERTHKKSREEFFKRASPVRPANEFTLASRTNVAAAEIDEFHRRLSSRHRTRSPSDLALLPLGRALIKTCSDRGRKATDGKSPNWTRDSSLVQRAQTLWEYHTPEGKGGI